MESGTVHVSVWITAPLAALVLGGAVALYVCLGARMRRAWEEAARGLGFAFEEHGEGLVNVPASTRLASPRGVAGYAKVGKLAHGNRGGRRVCVFEMRYFRGSAGDRQFAGYPQTAVSVEDAFLDLPAFTAWPRGWGGRLWDTVLRRPRIGTRHRLYLHKAKAGLPEQLAERLSVLLGERGRVVVEGKGDLLLYYRPTRVLDGPLRNAKGLQRLVEQAVGLADGLRGDGL